MKRIFFFIILLLSFATSFAQVPQKMSTWYEMKLAIADSLGLPRDTFPVPVTMKNRPWLSWKNDLLYTWSPTLLKWIVAGGTITDSTGNVYATTSYVDQKANAVRSVYTLAPLFAPNDSTFAMNVATDAQNGYLTSADHLHFNEAYNKYSISASYASGTLTFTRKDGTTWTVTGFGTGSGGTSTIAGATDASIVNPANNQALIFSAALAKWTNQTFVPITLTNPSTSDVIAPNGSGGAINVHAIQMDTTAITDGKIPYWKAATGKLAFEPIVGIDVTNATDGKVATWSAGKLVLAAPTGGSGASIDTTSLSNRINLKLNISDTANMLSPYLRKNVAAATYQPIGSYATTSQLSSYALLASPALTGVPTAPTAVSGTNTTQLATTAFVTSAVAASTAGVSQFNGRTGAITPVKADYSAFFADLGGAYANPSWITSLAYSKLTGTPVIPTQTSQLANTSGFMTAALADGTSITGNGVSGTPLAVAANGVTYAKFQQMAASTLMGNPTGALSTPQGITLGAGLAFSGAVLVNTITNTNQLTNGSNFISSAAGLISQGANMVITGAGTTANPYVLNASAVALPNGQIGYGNSAGTGLASSALFGFNGTTLNLGNATATATATPMNINAGATYSTTAGANPKMKVFDDGTTVYGFGVSSGQLDYIASYSGSSHNFYIATGKYLSISSTGTFVSSGNLTVNALKSGATAPTTTGTTKMVVSDANGLLSVAAIPAGGSSFANGTATTNSLFWNGSTYAPRNIAAADVPVLNQNTTGTAANITGIAAIANGGTGQATQQAAMNALAGVQSAGKYLRSDGTNTTLSTIQAADVPVLNQNTTGNAATATTATTASSAAALSTNLPVTNLNSGTGASAGKFWRGDGTWSSILSAGNAVTQVSFLELKPTDYGAGKPELYFNKTPTANQWEIGIYDGANNNGTLNIQAQNLTWNGSNVVVGGGTIGQVPYFTGNSFIQTSNLTFNTTGGVSRFGFNITNPSAIVQAETSGTDPYYSATRAGHVYFKVDNGGNVYSDPMNDGTGVTRLATVVNGVLNYVSLGTNLSLTGSTLNASASAVETVTEVTTQNYTVSSSDRNVIYEFATGGGTFTLPASPVDGEILWISNTSSGNITTSANLYSSPSTFTTGINAARWKKLVYVQATGHWMQIAGN